MKNANQFTREYLDLHVAKEDVFWTTYMGTEKDENALPAAEGRYKEYISDPSRLQEVRAALAALSGASPDAPETGDSRKALEGWLNFFSAHSIEDPRAQKLQKELIDLETSIFQRRAKLKLTYKAADGEEKTASTNVLASNIAANENEGVRKTSHDALLQLEQWILAEGFLELIRKRNEFARTLGYDNYFDYRVHKNESMTSGELFQILNEFEKMTRNQCFGQLGELAKLKGQSALLPHNIKYAVAGDAEKKLDPYLSFAKSLENWSRSFARLGISYRGATLQLDLFDRTGKYENGFMHGPQPCFFDQGKWRPARINFTSNATPNQVGSGRRGLQTLFHEGGHAAHFANITQNAPCFSQEYPPTSMAYAETQSMFCDSLIGDGDWLKLYGRDENGTAIPDDVIQLFVTLDHPFRAFQERSILVVPIFERHLYSMPDQDLTPEKITALARRCEREILGVDCSPRPLMAIPHLLGAESACSYQGYLLAHMAVYQTRSHFRQKFGYLADNPAIGPELAKYYWNPGNSVSHRDTIRSLTGKDLSGRELAEFCNLGAEELWSRTQKSISEALARAEKGRSQATALDATIRIVHGSETIAENTRSMEQMWSDFEGWIARHYPS
ncbi:MAG: peptidase M3 [Bdellovibrionales bacterium GWB1_55_8]|nr:MAG: peptidase M3 [Bdellovibrionales bacterium GWB1_55_8]